MKNLLIFLALPLLALDNSVRIYDASGSTQTNQPRTIHRYFAQGEFPSGTYPKPRVTGGVPATWQVDVESTWPDGSVMAAFVSLPVSIAANGNVVVDFISDANPCHLGNLSTCQAAGLDQTAMLAFNGGTWDATLGGTANSITYSASARTILAAGSWTYRLRGPVVTQVIIEDLTRPNPAYDFGWEYTGGAWAAPSGNNFKSIHPFFTASFYAGWAGVELEVIAVQGATTRLQRQIFDLAVTKSAGASVYSKSAFDLPRSSAFTRYFWDGTTPAAVQIDFNLKYMIYSRILPPFDYSKPRTGSTDLGSYTTSLNGADPQDCNPGASSCANWTQYIPSTGGRGDIGLIPRWYVTYLFAMGDTGQFNLSTRSDLYSKGVLGNADAAQTIPFHYLEYDNSTLRDSSADGQRYYFDAARTTPAFGRVPSTYARPEWLSGDREPLDGTDKMVPVCTSGLCDGSRPPNTAITKGWTIDTAHMPSPFMVPYMLSGRYSYLRAQYGLASYMSARQSYSCYYYFSRCADWSLFYLWGNQRADAWGLREIAAAALIAPSAAPEKAYFTRILEKNDELWEGIGGVTGGNAGDTTATNFCRGADNGSASKTHTSSSSTDYNGWGYYRLNGVTKVLGMPDPIYSVTGVTVDSVSRTVGVKGVDTGRDWYYYPGGFTLFQDDAADPVSAGSTVVVSYHKSTTINSPWCSGRHLQMKGMANTIGHQFWPEQYAYGSFMLYYSVWVRKFIEDTGAFVHSTSGQPLYKYSNKETGRHLVGWATDSNANPHYADMYTSYSIDAKHAIAPDWSTYMGVFAKTSTIVADMTNSATTFAVVDQHATWPYTLHEFFAPIMVRVENEWISVCSWAENSPSGQSTMTVCTGGRGYWGTAAVSHSAGATFNWDRQQWNGAASGHSYPNLYASSVAMLEEYSFPSGSGRRAWERAMGDMHGQQNRMDAPEYGFVPRDRIANLRAVPDTGTLSLGWTAPSGAACKVAVGASAPATSDDAADSSATVKSRYQTYSATGLSAGTAYYRVTCGTARTSGTVTIQ